MVGGAGGGGGTCKNISCLHFIPIATTGRKGGNFFMWKIFRRVIK